MGREAAQARDQAVFVIIGGGGELPNLDRLAEAVAVDGGGEVFERLWVEVGAVAHQRLGEDFGEGDFVH